MRALAVLILLALWAPLMAQDSKPSAPSVQATQVDDLLKDGRAILLDVREPSEIQELGTLPGSVHIPLGQLEQRLDELPKDRLILTA